MKRQEVHKILHYQRRWCRRSKQISGNAITVSQWLCRDGGGVRDSVNNAPVLGFNELFLISFPNTTKQRGVNRLLIIVPKWVIAEQVCEAGGLRGRGWKGSRRAEEERGGKKKGKNDCKYGRKRVEEKFQKACKRREEFDRRMRRRWKWNRGHKRN